MKVLHSADWQLGCAFSGFGARAERLRDERVRTLRRSLELARKEKVDAFLIAGDLFDDNQVAVSLVEKVCALFADFDDVRVIILPGNHDPVSGPGSIWARKPFNDPPPNVEVFTEAAALEVGDGFVVGSPIRQKLSTTDPSAKLGDLVKGLPGDAIKVGMTHGALAIPGKHQLNDHPIHTEAATKQGLDYLAIGHWHGWLEMDGGRLMMPGTPEPDAFDHSEGRHVALVEIEKTGVLPKVEKLDVAGLTWVNLELDFVEGEEGRAALEKGLEEVVGKAKETVVRVMLRGSGSREVLSETRAWLDQKLGLFLASVVKDESSLALSAAELEVMRQNHPLLAQVVSDLDRVRVFATGKPSGTGEDEDPLTPEEFRELQSQLGLEGVMDEEFFKTASALLLQNLQEAGV